MAESGAVSARWLAQYRAETNGHAPGLDAKTLATTFYAPRQTVVSLAERLGELQARLDALDGREETQARGVEVGIDG